MNEYGMSGLQMLQMIGPLMLVGPLLIWMLLIGPLLVYPLARWKAARETFSDDQLGIKVALHYFKLLAFQVALLGALMLVWTIISKGGGKSAMVRASFGFLVPAGIVYGVHRVFLGRTNDRVLPNVQRLFLGYNLLVTGIVGFTMLVLASQALFAKGSTGNEGRLFFAGLVVYGGAWVALALAFARLVLGDGGASSGRPAMTGTSPGAATHGGPGAAASPPAGPSLPPLGSAFPPIDPT